MTLVAPPFVHPHEQATKPGPKILQFRLVIQEKEIVIDNEGTKLQAMTFNGSIPGPLSAHEGDYLEVTLVNPETNSMPHNIDFHAGENDLYIPRDAKGKFNTYRSPGDAYADTIEVMRKLIPTHIVFNGQVGALTGNNAMTAKVGDTVLIVHSQANRDSRPHLIGGHGDYVWETGKFANPPETGLETWFIRGGSAGAALYTFHQPGVYVYVTHTLIEAVELGATLHFKVEGSWNDDLMTQVKAPEPTTPAVQGMLDLPTMAPHRHP